MGDTTARIARLLLLACVALSPLTTTGCKRQEQPTSAGTTGETTRKSAPVVGIANYGAHPILDVIVDAFKDRLRERGYVDEDTLVLVEESAEGNETLFPAIARDLLSRDVDIIISITTPVSQAVYKAAHGKKSIIFCGVTDPISAGLVDSWDNQPGSGITGTSDRWPYAEQLDLIKEITTGVKVGFPYNSGEANSRYAIKEVTRLAQERGLEILPAVVTNEIEVRQATESLASRGVDVIYVSSDNTVMAAFEAVLKIAHERKIPVIVGESANVRRGGLATVSVDYKRLGVATADILIRVLGGEEPGTIPVATFKGEELIVNLNAARKMGVEIPTSWREKADELIGGEAPENP